MAQAKAIPDGMHTVSPHLTVKGAAQAIEFYQRAFGAKELSRSAAPDGLIMHATLKIGTSTVFLNDEFPGMGSGAPPTVGGTAVTLHLYVEDADAVFKAATQAGAEVRMPLDDQFWGDRYGVVRDPFGHLWSIATHKEDLPPEELKRRGQEAMEQMAKMAKK